MALIKDVTQEVEIPHEPGESMTFRKLSWRELEQAAEEQQAKSLKRMKEMGGDVLQAITQSSTDTSSQEGGPENQYDKKTVLVKGIRAWSYQEKVTPDNIDMLDRQTADWAFSQIIGMNAEGEEAGKNG